MNSPKRYPFAYTFQFIGNICTFFAQNKGLIIYPIISLMISFVYMLAILSVGIFKIAWLEYMYAQHFIEFLFIFASLFLILSYINLLINASLIACTTRRLKGENVTISEGFRFAMQNWKQLLGWSILSMTIGILLNLLERSHQIFGVIVGMVLGVTWSVSSYFVIPTLVMEGVGPFAALKRSAKVFGRNWRKVISVTAVFFLILFLIIAVTIGLEALLPSEKGVLSSFLLFVFFIWMLFIGTVGRAFSSIMVSALYVKFRDNMNPIGFDQVLLNKAFVQKK